VTLDGNWIKCDAFGCEIATIFDVRTMSTGAKSPKDIRRWFAMDGWTSVPGGGGSEGMRDYCPLH
jgi:hypothetical protein